MAVISYNMAEVPDKVPALDADIYVFKITKAEIEQIPEDATYNPGKNQLVLQLQVDQEGHKNHGRMQFDRIIIDDERDRVKLKNLIKSAGLIPGPNFDTDDLIDKRVKGDVKNRPGKGENSGEIYANVAKYLF